jgi:hypothetical protein
VLAGQHLYADLLETNPPAFFWMMLVPAGASRHLPLRDDRLIGANLALLLILSTLLALAVLRRTPRVSRQLRFVTIAAFYAGLLVPFSAEMAQREMIAAVLVLPYTLLAARAAAGDPAPRPAFRILVAALAGAGFAIKPFFLAAWGTTDLDVLACTLGRSGLRLEALVVAAVQIVFVGLVILITPDYVTRIVPLARATYDAYGRSRLEIVLEPQWWVLFGLALTALWAGRLGAARGQRLATVFAAATIGWLIEYAVQGKGWTYQFIPAAAFAAVTFAVLASDVAAALQDRVALRRAGVALVVLGLVAAWGLDGLPLVGRRAVRNFRAPYRGSVQAFARTIRNRAQGEPVYMLSTSMWPIFPAVNLARSPWPYRYHFLWPIPGRSGGPPGAPFTYRGLAEQTPIERDFFDAVIEDLERTPPRLLFVDRRERQQAMHGRRFDFVGYFSASDRFRALLGGYRQVETIAQWEVYERMAGR